MKAVLRLLFVKRLHKGIRHFLVKRNKAFPVIGREGL
jgi:hypothetical protein